MLADDPDGGATRQAAQGERAEGGLGELAQATIRRRAIPPREREPISRMPGYEGEQGSEVRAKNENEGTKGGRRSPISLRLV